MCEQVATELFDLARNLSVLQDQSNIQKMLFSPIL